MTDQSPPGLMYTRWYERVAMSVFLGLFWLTFGVAVVGGAVAGGALGGQRGAVAGAGLCGMFWSFGVSRFVVRQSRYETGCAVIMTAIPAAVFGYALATRTFGWEFE